MPLFYLERNLTASSQLHYPWSVRHSSTFVIFGLTVNNTIKRLCSLKGKQPSSLEWVEWQVAWQTDKKIVRGWRRRWATVTDIHPALCEQHATVVPFQQGRIAPPLSLEAETCQILQFSQTQTLWPSARGIRVHVKTTYSKQQCSLKGMGLFMESFKVTALWASLTLTALGWGGLANAKEHAVGLC